MIITGAWEMPDAPLVICTPHQSKQSFEWATMFNQLQKPPICSVMQSGKLPVDCARDKMVFDCVDIFKDQGYTGFPDIFFLDSDVLMAPQDLLQLLSYPREEFPIVSGLYWAKKGERCPAVWIRAKKEFKTENRYAPMNMPDYGQVPNGGLLEVDGVVGAGCLLIRGEVFEKVPSPWFFYGTGRCHSLEMSDRDVYCSEEVLPFAIHDGKKTPYGYVYGSEHSESEDFYFCMKARSYGYKIYLDPNIRCFHEFNGRMDGNGFPLVAGD